RATDFSALPIQTESYQIVHLRIFAVICCGSLEIFFGSVPVPVVGRGISHVTVRDGVIRLLRQDLLKCGNRSRPVITGVIIKISECRLKLHVIERSRVKRDFVAALGSRSNEVTNAATSEILFNLSLQVLWLHAKSVLDCLRNRLVFVLRVVDVKRYLVHHLL